MRGREPLPWEENEVMRYMGIRDGILYVDAAKVRHVRNMSMIATNCSCFVDKPGNAAEARKTWNRQTLAFDYTPEFETEARLAMGRNRENDSYIVVLDLHS